MCKFIRNTSIKLLGVLLVMMFFQTTAWAMDKNQDTKTNDYPIILVHGVFGWGRDEVLGYRYWGGFDDIQTNMRNKGFKVYTASVGAVSSNWDRACELYACIKGGRVDYGKAHSKKYGHKRYGKVYPGLYPQWGQKDHNGNIKKIHLVGHSMGGQTIRTLVQLLKERNNNECDVTNEGEVSSLFKGDKSWVCSVTSIATPHDGSSFVDINNHYIHKYGQSMLMGVATSVGNYKNFMYDFDVEQWGIKRKINESVFAYANRVWNSRLWETKDMSRWDLSPQGARELNKWVKAQPDVYYFSWTTNATIRLPITGNVIPDPVYMNPILIPTGTFIVNHRSYKNGINIDYRWFANDGAVSVISANGPKLGSHDKIVEYNPNKVLKKGQWNHMGILEKTDHMDIIGIGNFRNLNGFYDDVAKQLTSLSK